MTTTIFLVAAGTLMLLFGAVGCWGAIDVVRNVWDTRTGFRVGEQRRAFVGYVVLIVLIPEALAFWFGWLFFRVLWDR